MVKAKFKTKQREYKRLSTQEVHRLLMRGSELGLRIERLYLDRGFDNNAVISFLKTQPFPAIIPLIIRGQTGGSPALLKGRRSSRTSYTRAS